MLSASITSRITHFLAVAIIGLVLCPLSSHGQAPDEMPTTRTAPNVFAMRSNGNVASEGNSSGVDLLGRWYSADGGLVAVEGDMAYLLYSGKLEIVDVSSPSLPVVMGWLALPSEGSNVSISGDYAYVADRSDGVRIIDIRDPRNPSEVGFYRTADSALDAVVSGNVAYVADYTSGLRVIDVSDPQHPFETGFFDTPGWAGGVAVSGNVVYVADYTGGLRVIDVSDPQHPLEVGFYDAADNALDVAVSGNVAYVVDYTRGVRVIDVGDPEHPVEVGMYDDFKDVVDIAVLGDYAFVLSRGNGLRVLDISNPSNPTETGLFDASEYGYSIAVSEFKAYLFDDQGVRVIDAGNPENLEQVGFYNTPGWTNSVTLSGSLAYAGCNDGLWIIDVRDPARATTVGFCATEGAVFDVVVLGGYAYVTTHEVSGGQQGFFTIIDVRDPANPTTLSSFEDIHPRGMDVSDDYLYVLRNVGSLCIGDVSTPPYVYWTPCFDTLGYGATNVSVSGNHAYVANYFKGFYVVDVSDPANPYTVTVLETDADPWGVEVLGHYAYVTEGNMHSYENEPGLLVVDISDPANPTEVGFYNTGHEATGISLWGHHAFVGDAEGGLRVFDVSDPANPVEKGHYVTGFRAGDVAVAGNRAYVTDIFNGLYILDCTKAVSNAPAAYLDIKPGSCTNPLNINTPNSDNANGGVIPAAVLGSEAFDVHEIDVSSLELEGAAPLRYKYGDVGAPPAEEGMCACSDAGPDGHLDLTLKFPRLEVIAALGPVSGANVQLALTGRLKDGSAFELSDCVKIVPKKGNDGPRVDSSNEVSVTRLETAVPNPFNPVTHIRYQLRERGYVTLKVYDVSGRLVATLVDGERPGGWHEAAWDAKGMTSGVYFYRLTAPGFEQTRKMVMLK